MHLICQSSSVRPIVVSSSGHRVTCPNDQRPDGRQQRQSARQWVFRNGSGRFGSRAAVIVSSRQSSARRGYRAPEEPRRRGPKGTGHRGREDKGIPHRHSFQLIPPGNMTTEEKFNAAVNVIRNLPKNGAYQPSHEIMLRFYSYYKQAIEGPCQQSKPAFWEVIKKAKWDAWTRLGNMSRTEAMNNYVEELKKIVETMSYTDNVATFLGSLDSFYESVPAEDLELLVGPVLERMRSQPGSPLSGSPLVSRETSPHRVCNASRHITSSLETSPTSSRTASPLPQDTDGEEEEFIDTVESAPEKTQKDTSKSATAPQKVQTAANNGIADSSTENATRESTELINGYSNANGHAETVPESHRERGRQRTKKDDGKVNAEFLNQIATTMQHLQRDLDRITARVRGLEGQALQALAPQTEHAGRRMYAKWWPLQECPPRLFVLLILWPFVAHLLINFVQRYRQRKL